MVGNPGGIAAEKKISGAGLVTSDDNPVRIVLFGLRENFPIHHSVTHGHVLGFRWQIHALRQFSDSMSVSCVGKKPNPTRSKVTNDSPQAQTWTFRRISYIWYRRGKVKTIWPECILTITHV